MTANGWHTNRRWTHTTIEPGIGISRSGEVALVHVHIPMPPLKIPSLIAAWLFWTFHSKSDNMKTLVILSHSWSPFLPPTCLYEQKEHLWVCVSHSGIFSWEKTPSRLPMQITWPRLPLGRFVYDLITVRQKENVNITLLDLCLFTFYSVHVNESTYPPDVRWSWETFTKLFLSNIINHGESDVQWSINKKVVIWAFFWISLWKEKVALIWEAYEHEAARQCSGSLSGYLLLCNDMLWVVMNMLCFMSSVHIECWNLTCQVLKSIHLV